MSWSKMEEKKNIQRSATELFKPIKEVQAKQGLKIGVHGVAATGKTHFCCSCPEPVYILETEFGAAQLAQQFPNKDIRVLNCYVGTGDAQQDCRASLDLMKEAVNSLSDITEGTICIDSGTDLWEWIQGVLRLDILKVNLAAGVQPSDYKWANATYRALIMKCLSIPANFVITAHEEDVYKDAKLTTTGVTKPSWQKQTPYWVDIHLRLYRETVQGKMQYKAEILKFRNHNLDTKIYGDMNYEVLHGIIKPYIGETKK